MRQKYLLVTILCLAVLAGTSRRAWAPGWTIYEVEVLWDEIRVIAVKDPQLGWTRPDSTVVPPRPTPESIAKFSRFFVEIARD